MSELTPYLEAQQTTPFEWGFADCVQFAMGAVEHLFGENPGEGYEYDTERAALRLIAEHGSLEALISSRLGAATPDVKSAELGDVVLSSFQGNDVVGVAEPPLFWLRTDQGVLPLSLTFGLKVWKCRTS